MSNRQHLCHSTVKYLFVIWAHMVMLSQVLNRIYYKSYELCSWTWANNLCTSTAHSSHLMLVFVCSQYSCEYWWPVCLQCCIFSLSHGSSKSSYLYSMLSMSILLSWVFESYVNTLPSFSFMKLLQSFYSLSLSIYDCFKSIFYHLLAHFRFIDTTIWYYDSQSHWEISDLLWHRN